MAHSAAKTLGWTGAIRRVLGLLFLRCCSCLIQDQKREDLVLSPARAALPGPARASPVPRLPQHLLPPVPVHINDSERAETPVSALSTVTYGTPPGYGGDTIPARNFLAKPFTRQTNLSGCPPTPLPSPFLATRHSKKAKSLPSPSLLLAAADPRELEKVIEKEGRGRLAGGVHPRLRLQSGALANARLGLNLSETLTSACVTGHIRVRA